MVDLGPNLPNMSFTFDPILTDKFNQGLAAITAQYPNFASAQYQGARSALYNSIQQEFIAKWTGKDVIIGPGGKFTLAPTPVVDVRASLPQPAPTPIPVTNTPIFIQPPANLPVAPTITQPSPIISTPIIDTSVLRLKDSLPDKIQLVSEARDFTLPLLAIGMGLLFLILR